MAKVPPDGFFIPGRGIRLRGVAYSNTHRGTPYMAAAPRRPKGSFSQNELDNQQLFKRANVNAAYMSAAQQITARRLSEVTAFNVRDLLLSTLYARMWRVPNGKGGWRTSVVARQDASELLDAFGQVPNSMLIRGLTWWDLLLPGNPGDELKIGLDGAPFWDAPPPPAGSPGGSTLLQQTISTSTDFSSFATKGITFEVDFDIEVTAVWVQGDWTLGNTYKATVGHVPPGVFSGNVTTIVQGPTVTIQETLTDRWQAFPLSAPVAVSAGSNFMIAATKTGGLGTDPMPINGWTSGNSIIALPGRPKGQIRLTNAAPVAGSPFTVVAGFFAPCIGLTFAFA